MSDPRPAAASATPATSVATSAESVASSKRNRNRSLSPSRSSPHHHVDPFINEVIILGREDQYASLLKTIFPEQEVVAFEVAKEGITNHLISCQMSSGTIVLIRIYGRKTELIIDRLGELSHLKLLAHYGLAEPVYGRFRNGLVYGYIEGKALKPEDVPRESIHIAQELRRWHSTMPVQSAPLLFHIIDKYFDALPQAFKDPQKQSAFEAFDLAYLEDAAKWLRENLVSSPIVFCHNDLLSSNMIRNPDDPHGRVIKFIDCEYAGPNPRAFDIANHFCEWAGLECNYAELFPTAEQRRVFFEAYGLAPVEQLEEEFLDYEPVPHLVWTLWSILQAQYSDGAFDYIGYGLKRYRRLRALIPINN